MTLFWNITLWYFVANIWIPRYEEKENVYDVPFYFQGFWLRDDLCIQRLMQTQIGQNKPFLMIKLFNDFKVQGWHAYAIWIQNKHWNNIFASFSLLKHPSFKCESNELREYWLKSWAGDWIGGIGHKKLNFWQFRWFHSFIFSVTS